MIQKHKTFNISKINNKTIKLAQILKKEIEKTMPFKETFLPNPEAPIPLDGDNFLGYLCLKHLHLKPEDGIPLLEQAFKQQYNIDLMWPPYE